MRVRACTSVNGNTDLDILDALRSASWTVDVLLDIQYLVTGVVF